MRNGWPDQQVKEEMAERKDKNSPETKSTVWSHCWASRQDNLGPLPTLPTLCSGEAVMKER